MKKIKLGLAGVGRAGWGMHTTETEQFPDKFEFAGAYDEIPSRSEAMVKRYPGCKKFNSFEELIHAPEIEVVVIAVRSPEHIDYAIQAIEAGKIVFAEKPIALNYAEVLKLKAVAEKHPGKLFCRQNRRFEAAFQHVTEIIKSGILGEVFEIKLCRHNFNQRCDWQTLKKFGGGQLNNWGPHLIDHALQFVNYEVDSVWGDTKQVAAAGDADDHFKAIIRGKSGLIVDVEVSGGVAIPSPVYCVYGTHGTLVAYNESEFHLKYWDMTFPMQKISASPETPSLDYGPYHQQVEAAKNQPKGSGSYSGLANNIKWIEEVIKVAPKSGATVNDIYKHLYAAIRENVPFPIRNEDAFEVVRITEEIRKNSLFK